MNPNAYNKLYLAECEYLLANGWEDVGPDAWEEPHERDRCLSHGHAVNSQKARDRKHMHYVKLGLVKE